ncbi:MAG: type II toxin-antitoxin system VapC family toxin [Thiohalocapsa sp.]
MRYLLDTNAVIALTNQSSENLVRRVRRLAERDIAISSIVMQELYFGAYKSTQQTRNLAIADALQFGVIEFDQDDARQAGEIRGFLRRQGTPIGPYDVLIAGQAVARNVVLVTRNVREFARVPRLQVENWET